MDEKLVANLIVAGGSKPDLFECLLSLGETTHPHTSTIVVDNSLDGLGAGLAEAFPHVEILRPNRPLAFARVANHGLRHAISSGAQLVFLLNDDVTVHPEAVGMLVEAERASGPGLYAPEIWPYEHGAPRVRYRFDWSRRLLVREVAESAGPFVDLDYAEASAVMISAAVFEKIGGFDEQFGFYFEDADLSLRARDAGFPVREVAGARAWHKVSRTAGRGLSPFKAYYRARNAMKFALKHRRRSAPAANALYHLGGFLLPEALKALAKTAAGSRRSASVLAALTSGTWDFCTGNKRPFRPGPVTEGAEYDYIEPLGAKASQRH